ncbi:GIY-YIG nuclease family protein [candidate division KSB1 bacterium]
MSKEYYIHILTNKNNTVLYTGMTNDLRRRVAEHKEGLIDGFSKNYNISKLIYYEIFDNVSDAILREKQIKNYSRERKEGLIQNINPDWNDLFNDIF